jgi:hypothetical protein
MATELLSIDELDRRHVAEYDEYVREAHAPGRYRRRQVPTGAEGVTDHRVEYHAEMATLDKAVFATRRKLRQARQDRQNWSDEEVHLRALLMKTTKTANRRNFFFNKYTKMIEAPPSDKHTTNTTSHDAIESHLSPGPPTEAIESRHLSTQPACRRAPGCFD